MSGNELAMQGGGKLSVGFAPNPEQIKIIKSTVCRGATDDELKFFLMICDRTGLDPFAKQIHSVPRKVWNKEEEKYDNVRVTQVGIDGLRTISDRSFSLGGGAKYGGETGPFYCGIDGVWKEIWASDEPPFAAKGSVIRLVDAGNGTFHREEISKIVHYDRYVQTYKDKKTQKFVPTKMWDGKSGAEQLGKCALAAAHRAAFPLNNGLYLHEEMAHVDTPETELKRAAAADTQEFIETFPEDLKARLKSLGCDTEAKQRSLANEAGNTIEGVVLHLDAVEFHDKLPEKLRDQIKFAGYKSRPEMRRMLVKLGRERWNEKDLKAFLEGAPVDAEVVAGEKTQGSLL